ncbi:MAG: asparagine synthase (glutamine-hydrolyzing), partial [Verrucomicrobia bacterium]|nr:asparagine synthase (glutamine-hydrolyzing) [Verrucomicrobiota bacterium]
GFRRLSIIDLSPAGHQPMSSEDGSVWLICNGEIYNFGALREELRGRGHVFKSATDVEVILHGYEEWGEAVLDRLDGMFALALWDRRTRRLFLARDRFGIKPLHYATLPEGLVFGSEIKALLAVPDMPRRLDPQALWNYLSLAKIPAPETIFKDIRKLPPGHRLMVHDGTVTLRRYYALPRERPLDMPVESAAEEVLRRLEAAVRTHLVADVPVGCFLSGGLDSSLIATLAARHTAGPLRTFSVTFEDSPDVDEAPYQKLMADRLGTEHHVVRARTDMTGLVPAMLQATDEPFAIASYMPLYHLSQLTRQHVKVVLSGDGGDELFAGYNTRYIDDERRRWLGWMRPLLGGPAAGGGAVWNNRALLQRLRRRADLARRPEFDRFLTCCSRFRDFEKRALLQPDVLAATPATWGEFLESAYDPGLPTSLERKLRFEAMTLLPDEMLTKVDRATSAFGLEGRVPFLDLAVAEFAWSVHPSVHWRAGQGKQVLRKTAERVLPPEIVHRPKGGFSVPLSRWLVEDRTFMRPLLLEPVAEFDRLIRPEAVRAMLAAHDAGVGEHGEHLWLLYVLKSWLASCPAIDT